MKTRYCRIVACASILIIGFLTAELSFSDLLPPKAGDATSVAKARPQPLFTPFYVYKDKNSQQNHFIPSGFMPDGHCITLDDAWRDNVKAGRSCVRIMYDTACSLDRQRWAGVYWQEPANNWGSIKGGFDLSGAQKLVFWARGEKGGEVIAQFRVGGMGSDQTYPDSAMASLEQVTLTKEWKEYTIDLHGKDMSRIAGGFAWSTSAEINPDGCVFYVDDVRFE